ncbi:siderophore-interacting protein [Nocardioides sp. zg-579]|uniref:Siderophore-interacting protein n=1 Tax=Nocardioides marmotae TaxID=2663857 RepID=A0A6I3JFD9_9ACTN|nr:siderophore-interacting protein [Nocardioides marmotae]MCR6033147.1 siderophore-interacting protein [Gordonia jinghuaiqii]MTB96799.1 siderophore-interacting protein [Nocardioides marmotae]QKE02997.1 siderophore-interacting protein [Nocardioides marmotae]
MTTLSSPALPLLLEEVEVVSVRRLSPSFVRVELGSPALAEFGVDQPLYDQRIKLIFPPAGAAPESVAGADEGWMQAWFARPAEERGHMRTYTIRDVRGEGADTRLVVDMVLHEADGHSGPGSSWAASAAVGDRIVLMCPRRGMSFGGIEFVPGSASRVVIAGDETAVPAACATLALLPNDAQGAVFLEVPYAADVQTVQHPEGVTITWLPREGAELGSLLQPAVLEHLGAPVAVEEVTDEEVDPDLWETPMYSSSGEIEAPLEATTTDGVYAWIAGESKVVTTLRRALVNELGMDRRQVSFMGYWRRGVAMKG